MARTMSRTEAKHMSEVLKAYSEGKTVQYYNSLTKEWLDMIDYSFSLSASNYRIKPEPKFRPYKDAEEFLEAQKKHGLFLKLKEKFGHKNYTCPLEIFNNEVTLMRQGLYTYYTWNKLLEEYVWQDGCPTGILE